MPVELPEVLRVEDPTGRVYYLGSFSPRDIKQLTFVPVVTLTNSAGLEQSAMLNEQQEDGYQRAGDYRRMSKISAFVKERPGCILPPVVLCARGKWVFKPRQGTPNFGALVANELAAIIDGQHRLGGIWQLVRTEAADAGVTMKPIPFMAVDEMTIAEEMREFVDINENQKGVKKSLLVYLAKDTTFWGQAAYALADDEESVFKGRIDIQKKHDWDLFLFGAAQESVQLLFGPMLRGTRAYDPFADASIREAAIEYLLRYWRAVSIHLSEYWADIERMPPVGSAKTKERPGTHAFEYRLLEETGIRAVAKLGCDIFAASWIEGMRAPSWDLIDLWLQKLAARDRVRLVLTKPARNPHVLQLDHELKSTGKAGVEAMYRHLHSELMLVIQER